MPRLLRPRGFTEKCSSGSTPIGTPAFNLFCDKLATRALLAGRTGLQFLIPLYETGNAKEIPPDTVARLRFEKALMQARSCYS
jgi:hypothetical protein